MQQHTILYARCGFNKSWTENDFVISTFENAVCVLLGPLGHSSLENGFFFGAHSSFIRHLLEEILISGDRVWTWKNLNFGVEGVQIIHASFKTEVVVVK